MTRWTFVLVLASALPSAAADVVYTKQPRFRIPYQSDPAELQRLGAREIQLYFSTDRGLNWRLAQAVPPTAGKFAYEAPSDGEYWFAVRTLDGLNRLHPPAGQITPGLKVAVDTQNPDLALSLERTGPQVRLSWRASDVNLDPSTLNLEFRQPGVDDWQPVQIVAQPAGQTAWSAPMTGTVAVRGRVSDRAGNAGTGSAELQVGEAGYAPLPANPELEGPIAGQPPTDASPANPFRMASEQGKKLPGHLASDSSAPPEITSRNEGAAPSPAAQTPEGMPRKIVNTRAFNLNYQVEKVGPSGVGDVEFFITEDGGQKWFRYGPDEDLQSPFRIDVPREGNYGFQVRVKSGVGLMAEPPRPGEVPAIHVTVDETPPVASLQPPSQTAGAKSPVVQLRWAVEDANPVKEKAIDLDFASSPDGPWTPIATGIDDQGAYDWALESTPPGRMFVRLTARDAAGNAGQAVTAEPIMVDLTRPTARITDIDVEPIK